jgi:glutaminase A
MGDSEGNGVASPIHHYLESLHKKYARVQAGDVASYIPELATADPDWFGICIATTDGQVYEVGDTRQAFTMQSISKPLVYGLALEDRGREAVLNTIGVEPTGDAFNSISLAPDTGRPLNPLINAGAIAATSLVAGSSDADKLHRILGVVSLYAGRQLSIDHVVYDSERATGHRNRAIGHMLRNFAILTEDPESALNLYFQQCSICIDCRDLSVIAASLANGGVNPLTGERVVRPEWVEDILSVMTTCGMYDYAGEWVYRVGMPAKSGVAGGILAVLPGQLGIGVFSPPLDARGNSIRIIDLKRVTQIDPAASHMLVELVRSLAGHGKQLFFTHAQNHPRFRRFLEEAMSWDAGTRVTTFRELDFALEWCESRLIAEYAPAHQSLQGMRLADNQLCKRLKEADVAHLQSVVGRERFNAGDLIIRKGEAADKLFFLMSGEVSVIVELLSGQLKRLSTVSPGMGFGESAIVDGGVRSADVRADKPVECWTLTKDAFERLGETHAELKIGLLQNLLRTVTQIANRMTDEVLGLEG